MHAHCGGTDAWEESAWGGSMHIEWVPALSVGVEQIDLQHQEIFHRINKLLDATDAGVSGETEELLNFLRDYVIFHFADEELAMARCGYPDARRHILQHKEFIEQLAELKQKYLGGNPIVTVAAHTKAWLVDWWLEHIGQVDCEMASYLIHHPPTDPA
jgi:hemerythrin